MKDNKVQISECAPLVPLSNKLRQLAQKSALEPPTKPLPAKSAAPMASNVQQALMQAQQTFDLKVQQQLSQFPEAKKHTLFKLRFGTLEALKAMPIAVAFKKLGIAETPALRVLQGLNYHGETVANKAT
jgi:hypothetical protein